MRPAIVGLAELARDYGMAARIASEFGQYAMWALYVAISLAVWGWAAAMVAFLWSMYVGLVAAIVELTLWITADL